MHVPACQALLSCRVCFTDCAQLSVDRRYTLAFLGYGEETDSCVFELTHNWDRKEPYSKGDRPGYAQVAISTEVSVQNSPRIVAHKALRNCGYVKCHVCYLYTCVCTACVCMCLCVCVCACVRVHTQDVYRTADVVKSAGGKVVREPGPIPGLNTKITSVLDPDGSCVCMCLRHRMMHRTSGAHRTCLHALNRCDA